MKNKDLGLLIIRVVLAIVYINFGIQKLEGGLGRWEGLGANMALLGISVFPGVWGFLAAAVEALGGLLLGLGLYTRISAALLAFTMFIAFLSKISGSSFTNGAFPFAMLGVLIAFIVMGAGKNSLDKKLRRKE